MRRETGKLDGARKIVRAQLGVHGAREEIMRGRGRLHSLDVAPLAREQGSGCGRRGGEGGRKLRADGALLDETQRADAARTRADCDGSLRRPEAAD